ncbi:MAG: hypothetical protein AAFR61_15175 [Bacteroidota bacterium]
MNLKTQFSVPLRNEEFRAVLEKIAQENGCDTHSGLLKFLVKFYHDHKLHLDNKEKSPKKPRKPVENPPKGTDHFVAKINPRAADAVEKMRDELFEEYGYEDAQIFHHFVRMHQKLSAKDSFLVEAPKALKKLILDKGREEVENGTAKNYGQYLSRFLFKKLKGGW